MESHNKNAVAKDGHWPYVLKRALPVGCMTLSAGYAANRYLIKHYPKSAPRNASMRTFLMIGSFLMGFVTTAEVYSLQYERMVMNKINNIDESQIHKEIELPKTVTDEALEYINNNRFKVFLGAWLASLGGAGYMVSRDRYMTMSQKVVQARMYAQGFTLLLIVGSAGLAMLDDKPKSNAHVFKDETWKTLINEDSAK
ncbi:hypothetical protein V1517DRAFT_338903 [Lipomyces orientalis]|uniref:Uncharacterized protein n=1 Tax=Lipomyces orientalis TaxID=1233043 RepID=A0ACC3TNC6_9ASCO